MNIQRFRTITQNSKTILFTRFTDRKQVMRDIMCGLLFFTTFIFIGTFEGNLILPDNGLGLFQHKNTLVFLLMNIAIPVLIKNSYNSLVDNLGSHAVEKLRRRFRRIASSKSTEILYYLSRTVGFCVFVGNSLQNAKIINNLPFDFWDSIHYPFSYVASRLYKLYLFSFFIPTVLLYYFVLFKSLSKLVEINDYKTFPISNLREIKVFCDFGISILLTITVPIILLSIVVYLIHERFDITTITTIVISIICTAVSLSLYCLLIRNYGHSLSRYKRTHVKEIDSKLAILHKQIMALEHSEEGSCNLETLLKEKEYLCSVKKEIENKSKFPHAKKALITSISPLIPTIIKVILSFEKLA